MNWILIVEQQEVYDLIENHCRNEHKNLVNRYVRKLGKASSEDAVQEAYLKALTYWQSYNVYGEFDNWFSQILNNCVYDKIKEEILDGMVAEEAVPLSSDSRMFNNVYLNDILKYIDKNYEPEEGAVYKLYFFEQYSSKDIAAVSNYTDENVRKLIQRFRSNINTDLNNGIE